MPAEPTSFASDPGSMKPSIARAGFRPGLFALLLLMAAALSIAIPLSARALQPGPAMGKAAFKQLPAAPAGVLTGLPYETRPAPQAHAPQRHGGPDSFGYIFDDEGEAGSGVVYSWTDGANRVADSAWQRTRVVSSTSPLDDGVMTTTLPFGFNYYGTAYTQLHISTNGNLHFGTPNDWYPDQTGACLPYNNPQVPSGMLAPLWYDLIVPEASTNSGGVYTTTIGTSPHLVYVIEWRHVSKYNPPFGYATFEVLLYQTGEIYFQYKDLTNPSINGGEGVVGIQNLGGSIGLPYSCYQSSVIEGRAIRYKLLEAAFLSPSTNRKGGAAGATITYTLSLLNRTGIAGSFNITHGGDTWPTTVDPPTTSVLSDSQSVPITVAVQIPSSARINAADTTIITATSNSSSTLYTASAVLTTTVNSYGADFSPGGQTQSGDYGATVNYSARITNRSPQTNDFDMGLEPSSAPWTTTVSPPVVPNIAPEASAPVNVSVEVPMTATFGSSDVVTVTARGEQPTPGQYSGFAILTTTAGSWSGRSNMQVWRARGAGVLFPPNGKIYALGGESFAGSVNLPIEEYDSYAGTWTQRAPLQVGVSNVGAAAIGNAIYIVGGYNVQSGGTQSLLQVYYPFEDRTDIIATDPLPAPRMGAGVASYSTTAYDGKLYVMGGSDNSFIGSNTLYIYDPTRPAHSRWQTGPSMPTARVYLAAATLGGRIYAAGGMPGGPNDLATVESYSPAEGTWAANTPMRVPRAGLALVGVERAANDPGCGGYLFALGGGWQNYQSTVERYDPASGTWGPASNLTVGRRSLMAAPAYSTARDPGAFALLSFGGWSGTYENISESAQCGGAAPPPTPTPAATQCPITFSDVHSTDYFYQAVGYLYCRGVISGYADGTFRPYNLTTRGQLAKIVVLAEGWTIYTPPGPTFRDVPVDHAFYQYIETAYSHGIISGYDCGAGCLEYRAGSNVTRGQLCKIVALAQGWTLANPPNPTFLDVPTDSPFYRYVETVYNHGNISGYGDGSFRPGNSATRGQISKIVYLAITSPSRGAK